MSRARWLFALGAGALGVTGMLGYHAWNRAQEEARMAAEQARMAAEAEEQNRLLYREMRQIQEPDIGDFPPHWPGTSIDPCRDSHPSLRPPSGSPPPFGP